MPDTADQPLTPASEERLSADRRAALATDLSSIISEHRSDVAEFLRGLVIDRRLYEMRPRTKTWPWPGASNLILPIVTYGVDHYDSSTTQALQAAKELFHASPVGGEEKEDTTGIDWKEIATDSAIALNYLTSHPAHVNLPEVNEDVSWYQVMDGTLMLKVHFVPAATTSADGARGRVAWDAIDITRCVWPIGASDTGDAVVLGHWTEMSSASFREFAERNDIEKALADRVLASADEPWFVEEERVLAEELGLKADSLTRSDALRIYRIHEIDVRLADGRLTVWWHQKSETILKAFTPADDARPFEIIRFKKRGRQFLGKGVPGMARSLNLGLNIIFNQAIDAATIANATGIIYKADDRLAEFLAGAQLYPGFRAPTDAEVPKDAFAQVQLGTGQMSPSIPLANLLLGLVEMVLKVGPGQMGQVSAGSRVPASVGLGIMQEGAQLKDAALSRIKKAYARAGYRTLALYAAHDPSVFDECLPSDRATRLINVLSDPAVEFGRRIRISLNVASATSSKEKDKQDLVVVANFLAPIIEKIIALSGMLTNPQVPQVAKEIAILAFKGYAEVLRRLFETFDQFRDTGAILSPQLISLMENAAAPAAPPSLGALPPAAGAGGMAVPAAAGPSPLPRLTETAGTPMPFAPLGVPS